ncbi:NAD(P)-dependent dehydrogenase (short-subunit alcohol dehydrogenase family) [Streptomyces luteogriseus]|nr:NAD(P)-dependent dehydrogenase (short-subunit alcohol dehydrogenase family) [Streptomyces luteogriseus]
MLVANAGIVADAALGAHTEANVDLTLAVNFKGPPFTVQKALPLLAETGSVLVVGSSTACGPMSNSRSKAPRRRR